MIGYKEIAKKLSGRLLGSDGVFESISIDSRNLCAGDLFVALQGDNFDANAFAEQAVASGASALMLNEAIAVDVPQIIVEDTEKGLGELAHIWRLQYELPVIAVTGSNGKTSVKEMLAAILSRMGESLVTAGNFNNHIGVPLTLLNLRERHRYAVIEMGANHPGEISYLSRLAVPDIALITNAAPAHLEGFGDIEGVAKAKSEIFESLPEQGFSIINADDPFAPLWREKVKHCQNIEFSLHVDAPVRGEWDANLNKLLIHTLMGDVSVNLPLVGEHNARNALAAAAVAMAVGAGLEEIRLGLEAMQPIKGRLFPQVGVNGLQILDDSYNANPASLNAALEVLSAMPGEAWLVLGDMAELGDESQKLHAQMGDVARKSGITRLFAIGEMSEAAVHSFGVGAEFFENVHDLVDAVKASASPGLHVLVKGSRAMHLEHVVVELLNESEKSNDAVFATGD